MSGRLEVAAGVIVDRRGFLATRRLAGAHMGGLWEFPGGKVRTGEAVVDALRRELREELGIQVDVGRRIAVVDHDYPDAGPVRLHFHVCRIEAGEPVPLASAEVRWVPPEALPELAWPPADDRLVGWLAGVGQALRLWDAPLHFSPTAR